MAGDWIKMRGNLWDDPRIAKLCDLTDQGEAAVIGGLYWLWAAADQHTEDGLMPGLTLRQIDRKTGVQGLGAALCAVGWLIERDDGCEIVRFDEHNGASAKRRCADAQRKANSRNVSALDADKTRTDDGRVSDEKRRSAELEKEKRREEKNPPTPRKREGGRFAEFWEAWPQHPRKAARPQCERKWRSSGCDAIADQILAAVRAQRGSHDWTRGDGEFIPAPLVWLNQARWEAPEVTPEAERVAADDVARTRALIDGMAAPLTPEQKARADEARKRAMAAIGRPM